MASRTIIALLTENKQTDGECKKKVIEAIFLFANGPYKLCTKQGLLTTGPISFWAPHQQGFNTQRVMRDETKCEQL